MDCPHPALNVLLNSSSVRKESSMWFFADELEIPFSGFFPVSNSHRDFFQWSLLRACCNTIMKTILPKTIVCFCSPAPIVKVFLTSWLDWSTPPLNYECMGVPLNKIAPGCNCFVVTMNSVISSSLNGIKMPSPLRTVLISPEPLYILSIAGGLMQHRIWSIDMCTLILHLEVNSINHPEYESNLLS